MVTIKKLAEELGMSESTVSKAINNRTDVSSKTKELILKKAIAMGYSFKTGIKKICVFIENIKFENDEQYGYRILNTFRNEAIKNGYIVDCIQKKTSENFNDYSEILSKRNAVGGFVLGINLNDKIVRNLKTTTYPTVLLDSVVKNKKICYIGIDNKDALFQAVGYLYGIGHKKICFVNGTLNSYVSIIRLTAFKKAMKYYNLNFNQDMAVEGSYNENIAEELLPKILKTNPTAIICASDLIAKDVMQTLQKKGYKIPEDISIIGFDNLPLCKKLTPTLSSIQQKREDIGNTAFFALNNLINGINISKIYLRPQLIIRKSVKEKD